MNASAQAAANAAKSTTIQTSSWDSVFDVRTYHVAAISFLEGTVKNSLLYWCPLIIYSLVSHNAVWAQYSSFRLYHRGPSATGLSHFDAFCALSGGHKVLAGGKEAV